MCLDNQPRMFHDPCDERLLRDVPRVNLGGKMYPSLKGDVILSRLGCGGQGVVYKGRRERLKLDVAIKILKSTYDDVLQERFYREAQAGYKINCPHVVRVLDVDYDAKLECHYIISEFVNGITLEEYVRRASQMINGGKAPMPAGEVVLNILATIVAASKGLNSIHEAGIVHRDVTPRNIIIPYSGSDQSQLNFHRAKVLDLGLAHLKDSVLTIDGAQAMGTPGFMSPEQAVKPNTVTYQSDVYGLAATLFASLARRPPFTGDGTMSIILAIIMHEYVPLRTIRPDLPAALTSIIDKCLAKAPADRLPSVRLLGRALQVFLPNCYL